MKAILLIPAFLALAACSGSLEIHRTESPCQQHRAADIPTVVSPSAKPQ